MEINSIDFSSPSFFVALILTTLCCFFAVRLKSKKPFQSYSKNRTCSCSFQNSDSLMATATASSAVAVAEPYMNGGSDSSGGGGGGGEVLERAAVVAERFSGASMMEQLVPEITTHALSYLDYPSLCRLSMTNSLMRKAANDDNAWKALYHKDFTLEQDSVTPVNGWKAYYAATKAIVNVNAEFFNIIRERSLPAMGRFWLNTDYVKCVHTSGELFTGYNAVMESWQLVFNWEQGGVDFQVRDVRARVLTGVAWVTMKTYVDMETGPFNVTNVFEFHNGRWYMVHHHSSLMLNDGGGQQIVQG